MQSDSKSCSMRQLPSALQHRILSLLPPNHRALSGRLVSPDAAAGLSGSQHCTASLSHPLPPHAVPWAVEAGQQHVRQLPFRHKLQLLCTAAASGSEANLEVALALLQPSIFPELLHAHNVQQTMWASNHVTPEANPGVAAVTAGHPQLLGWLLTHCPGLVECWQVLTATARHCDLAGLQATCSALSVDSAGLDSILAAAAESATPDAVAKMEWLMHISGRWLYLQESTAAAAARTGDLGRLQLLRERGCPMGGLDVLWNALQHADLAVAQWLVDEAGCELPRAVDSDNDTEDEDQWVDMEDEGESGWGCLLEAAAMSADGLTKVGWLQQQRQGPLRAWHWERMAVAAARKGRVEMVQHALSVLGPGAVPSGIAHAAVESGSVLMVQLVRNAGVALYPEVYRLAARTGSLAMVRWLACEAGVTTEGLDLSEVVKVWPQRPTAAKNRELLQAVQLLVEEAGWRGWNTVEPWLGRRGWEGTSRLVEAAAERGNLGLVQYLVQQRPSFQPGRGVMVAAVHGGCEVLLEWLAEQDPWCVTEVPDVFESAAAAGDLGTLTVLRRLGAPLRMGNVVANALAWSGFVPAARHWLMEQGPPVGSRRDVQEASAALARLGKGVDSGIKDWLLGLVGTEAAPGEEA